MLDKQNIQQNALSNNGDINQAARDNNIKNYYISELESITFYEEDIKEVIIFFNNKSDEIISQPYDMDLTPIGLEEKNEKNRMSESYFKQMIDSNISQFKKIKNFLMDPVNIDYAEMYQETVDDLQLIVYTYIKSVSGFEVIINKLYQHIINSQKNDRDFMKIRKKIKLFLHFMYYNCDIGIK